jgi:WD40 repeat protein
MWFLTSYSRILEEAKQPPAETQINVWDVGNGAELLTSPGSIFAFSPDGTKLALSSSGSLVLLDLATRHQVAKLTRKANILSCAFSPDGTRILYATGEGILGLWAPASGKVIELTAHRGRVTACACSREGNWAASVASDQMLKIWDADSGAELCKFWLGSPGTALSLSPNGRDVIAGSENGTLFLLRLESRTLGPLIVTAL